jgi:two-component system, OmpR family, sensor histidine kinase ArlS
LKIRNKITLLFTVLVIAILLILNLFVYYSSANERKENFRKRLRGRASNNVQIFDYFGDSSVNMLRRIDAGALVSLPQKSVAIFDTTRRVLYSYQAENAPPLQVDSSQFSDILKSESGQHYFMIGKREAFIFHYSDADKNFIIVVAAFDEDGRMRLVELKKLLLLSLLIGTLATLIIGYLFSSQLVRPIKDIIGKVNDISSHNLSKRLTTGNSQDELNDLAKTFNDLLNRLQESFTTQRRFISNASHELSTPLTSISSQLQVTLQKERPVAEYQAVLQSIQEDVEQMRQLNKSLLEIARAGSQGSIELDELRIDELLLKVIADIRRINEAFDVELQFHNMPEEEKQCMVFGNFDLIYIAIKNIIENGCKYSPDKTSVVRVEFEKEHIIIRVINQGDIITEQEAAQIFQPFFRGANAGENEGFGLGLPLAKRIVSLHKGTIGVQSDEEGTIFTITLPSLMQEIH